MRVFSYNRAEVYLSTVRRFHNEKCNYFALLQYHLVLEILTLWKTIYKNKVHKIYNKKRCSTLIFSQTVSLEHVEK